MGDNKEAQALEEIHNKLCRMIKGIDTTISAHLGSDDMNIDIIFLKKLYAEAKGLREAEKVVTDKLNELIKEDGND